MSKLCSQCSHRNRTSGHWRCGENPVRKKRNSFFALRAAASTRWRGSPERGADGVVITIQMGRRDPLAANRLAPSRAAPKAKAAAAPTVDAEKFQVLNCCGQLKKKSSGRLSGWTWKKWWLQVRLDVGDDENYALTYHKGPPDKNAAHGALALAGCAVRELEGSDAYKDFHVFDAHDAFELRAADVDERRAWVATLRHVVAVAVARERHFAALNEKNDDAITTNPGRPRWWPPGVAPPPPPTPPAAPPPAAPAKPSPTERFLAAAMDEREPPRQDAEGHAFAYVDAVITRSTTGMEMAVELRHDQTAVLAVATVWPASETHGVVKATDVLARINGVPLTELLREVGLELPVDFPLVKRYVRARPRPVTLTFRTRAGRDFVAAYQDATHARIARCVRRWRARVAAPRSAAAALFPPADDVPPLEDAPDRGASVLDRERKAATAAQERETEEQAAAAATKKRAEEQAKRDEAERLAREKAAAEIKARMKREAEEREREAKRKDAATKVKRERVEKERRLAAERAAEETRVAAERAQQREAVEAAARLMASAMATPDVAPTPTRTANAPKKSAAAALFPAATAENDATPARTVAPTLLDTLRSRAAATTPPEAPVALNVAVAARSPDGDTTPAREPEAVPAREPEERSPFLATLEQFRSSAAAPRTPPVALKPPAAVDAPLPPPPLAAYDVGRPRPRSPPLAVYPRSPARSPPVALPPRSPPASTPTTPRRRRSSAPTASHPLFRAKPAPPSLVAMGGRRSAVPAAPRVNFRAKPAPTSPRDHSRAARRNSAAGARAARREAAEAAAARRRGGGAKAATRRRAAARRLAAAPPPARRAPTAPRVQELDALVGDDDLYPEGVDWVEPLLVRGEVI